MENIEVLSYVVEGMREASYIEYVREKDNDKPFAEALSLIANRRS